MKLRKFSSFILLAFLSLFLSTCPLSVISIVTFLKCASTQKLFTRVWVCMHECVYVEASGQSWVSPSGTPSICFEMGLLIGLQLSISVDKITNKPHASSCLHFPSNGITKSCHHTHHFYVDPGIEFSSSYL